MTSTELDFSTVVDIVFTILLVLVAILQGTDSAFNLYERWRRRFAKPNSDVPFHPHSHKKVRKAKKKDSRWTQRKVYTVVWWLFVSVEIWPLYRFLSAFQTNDALLVWISYTIILFVFPLWLYKDQNNDNRGYVKTSILFLCLEMTLANMFVLGFFAGTVENWNPVVPVLHTIGFLGQRLSLIMYLGAEYAKPWFQRLPKA